jgi:PhnB protein
MFTRPTPEDAMTIELHPYLNFDGNTDQAMKFYAECLGGKLEIMRFGDSPMDVPADQKNRVMHATLKSDTFTLMASDTMPNQPSTRGNNVHLSLNFKTKEEQTRAWDRLSQGGKVNMPLGDQFFGRFGMLTDRFGINWMLHFTDQTQQRK